jgi:hypothetical protein
MTISGTPSRAISGPLLCVINGATRGRHWSSAAARAELRRTAAAAGVRRHFAAHQLRHSHAVRGDSDAWDVRAGPQFPGSRVQMPRRAARRGTRAGGEESPCRGAASAASARGSGQRDRPQAAPRSLLGWWVAGAATVSLRCELCAAVGLLRGQSARPSSPRERLNRSAGPLETHALRTQLHRARWSHGKRPQRVRSPVSEAGRG